MADNNLPARRIDREALERIIQRAAELQAGEMDTGENMTEAELLKLGADVGIDGRFLRQAMYEQTSGGGPTETGTMARWFGPKRVFASRVVAGDKDSVEAAIAQWMVEGEAMAVKRRLPDRTVWEQQRGFFAQMKRGFGMGGRQYHLARSLDVTVCVTALEAGFCHVELSADISMMRQGAIGASLGGAGVMVIVGGAAFSLFTGATALPLLFLGVAPLIAAAVSPIVAGRMQRQRSGQMQLALEQILDRLEHGEIKPRHQDVPAPFIRIAAEIRGAIRDGIEQSKKAQRKLGP